VQATYSMELLLQVEYFQEQQQKTRSLAKKNESNLLFNSQSQCWICKQTWFWIKHFRTTYFIIRCTQKQSITLAKKVKNMISGHFYQRISYLSAAFLLFLTSHFYIKCGGKHMFLHWRF